MDNYIDWLRHKIGHEPAVFVGVSAVIHNEKGEILLIKRGDNGAWACPGGIMEPGENVHETLMREIEEELGVDATIMELLGIYSNRGPLKYPNGDVAYIVGIFFVCTVQGVLKIDGNEALDAKFFELASLPNKLHYMQEQPLIDFFEGLRGIVR
ncbi:MAG: NUDIX domain-containing protein [bacterium]|nr:NUDIX domain-containing protein [bacterium]